MTGSIQNILSTFHLADAIDLSEGRNAYYKYNQVLTKLAAHYGVTLEQATAAFVTTSPNNDYFNNMRSAISLIDAYVNGKTLEDVTVSTYRECAKRAWRVLNGENFLDFTKGLKTRSFYMNILEPDNSEYVTVDGHMVGVWFGARMTMKEAVRYQWRYQDIANAVKRTAIAYGLIPDQLQAILWFTQKRIHNVVYDSRLNLFDDTDHWRIHMEPTVIVPFPERQTRSISQLDLPLSYQGALFA